MSTSKRIARIVGPTLIAVTVSETINLGIWKTNIPQLTYLNGMLLFVAGLSIVHAHNRWLHGWPVVLTLVGWLAMVLGLFRMFLPRAAQGGETPPTYTLIAATLAAGIFLTIKAYWPGSQRQQ